MKEKYMSIITNFGCHYKCPYCIVKNTGIDVPETTLGGLDELLNKVKEHNCNIVSVSGGGDPLYNFTKHTTWWKLLLALCKLRKLPVEVHTSYTTGLGASLVARQVYRMVYHLRTDDDKLQQVYKYGKEIVRVVYVVTDDMTKDDIYRIVDFVKNSPHIDELTFRQRVKPDYTNSYHLHDFLKAGHQKDWWYVEQNDYNLYYAENEVYERYSDFRKGE